MCWEPVSQSASQLCYFSFFRLDNETGYFPYRVFNTGTVFLPLQIEQPHLSFYPSRHFFLTQCCLGQSVDLQSANKPILHPSCHTVLIVLHLYSAQSRVTYYALIGSVAGVYLEGLLRYLDWVEALGEFLLTPGLPPLISTFPSLRYQDSRTPDKARKVLISEAFCSQPRARAFSPFPFCLFSLFHSFSAARLIEQSYILTISKGCQRGVQLGRRRCM